jgi:hypothetical protein
MQLVRLSLKEYCFIISPSYLIVLGDELLHIQVYCFKRTSSTEITVHGIVHIFSFNPVKYCIVLYSISLGEIAF